MEYCTQIVETPESSRAARSPHAEPLHRNGAREENILFFQAKNIMQQTGARLQYLKRGITKFSFL